MTLEAAWPRTLPRLTDVNRSFWTGGAGGHLLIQRCSACERWVHPPSDACSGCGGSVEAEPVSGRGVVFTYTVNCHQFHPDVPPPNLIAIVQLDEQEDLRIVSNIVGCDPEAVWCGMPVHVVFERHGEVFYPVFAPLDGN